MVSRNTSQTTPLTALAKHRRGCLPARGSRSQSYGQSPTDPMEGSRPASITRLVNAHEVNCVPWSPWITVFSFGDLFESAIPTAFVTSAVS